MVLEFAEGEVEPVGDGGFEEAAEALDRIEFGTIRRVAVGAGRWPGCADRQWADGDRKSVV